MKTPVDSRPFRNPPLNEKLYGGRLSITRFGVSIALVLLTLVISLAQNGGPTLPKSSPGPFTLDMPLP